MRSIGHVRKLGSPFEIRSVITYAVAGMCNRISTGKAFAHTPRYPSSKVIITGFDGSFVPRSSALNAWSCVRTW